MPPTVTARVNQLLSLRFGGCCVSGVLNYEIPFCDSESSASIAGYHFTADP
jgi:hypothetical protein